MMHRFSNIKQIMFDADDTLWQNNIYYLKATEDFFKLLASEDINIEEAECAFDELELRVVKERGYGSIHFVHILETLFQQYITRPDAQQIKNFKSILSDFNMHTVRQPMIMEGVKETLQILRQNYELYVLTKGDPGEQSGKMERSGLIHFFNDYYIPPEKDDSTFRRILDENNWLPEETCMVGNSPKSDINPALRCGLAAIYIHYDDTWKLDREPFVEADGRFVTINRFSELKSVFGV